MHYANALCQMNAICNANHRISFPPSCSNPDATDVMARCLDRNPRSRISIQVRRTSLIVAIDHTLHAIICTASTATLAAASQYRQEGYQRSS